MINDLWYKNAIIYCLSVEKYLDGNGDGIGDFAGLTSRLDYLAGLGVTCVWLQPFYPSPDRDNGYDVAEFYGVDPKYGTLGDYVEFMNHAKQLGIRVIVDLVVNHTSINHPWFRAARKDPKSPFREWYVWSKKRPANHDQGMVFPGVQKTTWTYDEMAGSTTSIVSTITRRISILTTPMSATRSAALWASGSNSAWRASAWTRCRS